MRYLVIILFLVSVILAGCTLETPEQAMGEFPADMEGLSEDINSVAGEAEEAIAEAEAINPDVILLDVMMPKMDGPTTLTILRQNAALDSIPIILMTARVQQTEIAEYIELGAAGVIPKPFNPMTLATEITKIWEKSHAK